MNSSMCFECVFERSVVTFDDVVVICLVVVVGFGKGGIEKESKATQRSSFALPKDCPMHAPVRSQHSAEREVSVVLQQEVLLSVWKKPPRRGSTLRHPLINCACALFGTAVPRCTYLTSTRNPRTSATRDTARDTIRRRRWLRRDHIETGVERAGDGNVTHYSTLDTTLHTLQHP